MTVSTFLGKPTGPKLQRLPDLPPSVFHITVNIFFADHFGNIRALKAEKDCG